MRKWLCSVSFIVHHAATGPRFAVLSPYLSFHPVRSRQCKPCPGAGSSVLPQTCNGFHLPLKGSASVFWRPSSLDRFFFFERGDFGRCAPSSPSHCVLLCFCTSPSDASIVARPLLVSRSYLQLPLTPFEPLGSFSSVPKRSLPPSFAFFTSSAPPSLEQVDTFETTVL